MLHEYISTGQAPRAPRELLRGEFLERMGRELVRLCDNIERHGLVDYQMGVWEEEIIDGRHRTDLCPIMCFGNADNCWTAITECLDLLGGNAHGTQVEVPVPTTGNGRSQTSR
jgi:hypothetical protein